MHDLITPVVITFNEEDNIARVLEQLGWAGQVIVVDSFSSDATQEICQSFPNVLFVQNEFQSPADQVNFGVSFAKSEWILALGADYVLSAELVDELKRMRLEPGTNAYMVSFDYCIFGKSLRGCMYPPAPMLYRRNAAHFIQDGHTERLVFSGPAGRLVGRIRHDDRKPLSRWLSAQSKYAALEVGKLLSKPPEQLSWKEWLRKKIVVVPVLTAVYCLAFKGLILDGWPGIYYTLQRVYAELLLSLMLLDARLSRRTVSHERHVDRPEESSAGGKPELAGSTSSHDGEHQG